MSYCVEALGDHELIQCDDYQVGGIDALALLENNHNIPDYEDEEDWQDALDSNLAHIVHNIKGEFPEPTTTEQPNPVGCGADTIPTGFDFVLNVEDGNSTSVNDDFWSKANGRTFAGLAWRECKNGIIKVVEEKVTVTAKPVMVPSSDKEIQRYIIQIKWSGRKDSHPVRYEEPGDIFNLPE